MSTDSASLEGFRRAWGMECALPEHRQIEMYSARKGLSPLRMSPPEMPLHADLLAGARHIFVLLHEALGRTPNFRDELATWDLYRNLPRKTARERLVGELYRLLRVVWLAQTHPASRIAATEELVVLECLDARFPVTLRITSGGLRLLMSAACFRLQAQTGFFGPRYVEAMLSAYYTDIVTEIRGFEDEGNTLYQFRAALLMNRHLRLACSNPMLRVENGLCRFELGPTHADRARFPIDFHFRLNDQTYLLPVEALDAQNAIALSALAGWEAGPPKPGDELKRLEPALKAIVTLPEEPHAALLSRQVS